MNSDLLDILENRPQDLLIADDKLQSQALDAVKKTFDPIASKYSIFEEIHVDGLDAEQVWAQAEMVIDGVVEKVMSEEIPELRESGVLKRTASAALSDDDEDDESDSDDSEGFESALENEEAAEAQAAEESNSEDEEEEAGIEAGNDSDVDMNDFDGKDDYEESDLEENEVEDEEEQDNDEEEASEAEAEDSKDKGAFGLNKGLFNLDDFKSQVLALEDDNMDDEDENIDFFADPDAQDSEFDEEKDDDVKFEDFFAPPKKTKSKKRTNKKSQEAFDGFNLEPENEVYEEAMDSVRKDLFADDDDEEEEEGKGKENLSTFEKQQREIMKQISQLESENVGEKSWQVKGEAKAKDRPENSLLEADLDFERSAKPVPVITQETTETLEDMIRRRIKTYDFDDLPRRVPDSLPEFKPSKLAEVQETKSTKGLGELYEEDFIRKENPDAYVSVEAEKQSEAHKEIKGLWSDLSRKLDTLSSWTYTPKAPKPSISIVANTAAIAMEEAQPTAMATESALAPQEVYNPTAESKREVVGHSGLPVAKSEMSREERKRERRKHKAKKSKILKEREEEQKVKAQKKGSKADIMQTLKKGNVTIIDKKGAKRDVSGNLKKNKAALGASQLKL